jgi:hypothetical protein
MDIERDGRERGSQPDGQRQPEGVDHGRKKAKDVKAVSYQLSAISTCHETES